MPVGVALAACPCRRPRAPLRRRGFRRGRRGRRTASAGAGLRRGRLRPRGGFGAGLPWVFSWPFALPLPGRRPGTAASRLPEAGDAWAAAGGARGCGCARRLGAGAGGRGRPAPRLAGPRGRRCRRPAPACRERGEPGPGPSGALTGNCCWEETVGAGEPPESGGGRRSTAAARAAAERAARSGVGLRRRPAGDRAVATVFGVRRESGCRRRSGQPWLDAMPTRTRPTAVTSAEQGEGGAAQPFLQAVAGQVGAGEEIEAWRARAWRSSRSSHRHDGAQRQGRRPGTPKIQSTIRPLRASVRLNQLRCGPPPRRR